MKKRPYILISDAKGGFRVSMVASNGQMLSQSEVLTTPLNVLRNMAASARVFQSSDNKAPKTVDEMWNAIAFCKIRYSGKNKGMALFVKDRNFLR